MGRRPTEYTIKVTHTHVHNPEAVERGLQLWTTYLGQRLGKRLAEEARKQRNASP